MAIDYNKVFTPSKRMWSKIAAHALVSIKKRTQRGRDRNNKKFPEYTEKYAELKAQGMKRKKGKRPAALKGIPLSRQTSPANFRLRGWTMRDLSKIAIQQDFAVIGWRDEFANIVAAHEEKGKYKVGGITDEEHTELVKIVDNFFVDKWNKTTLKVQTINVKL